MKDTLVAQLDGRNGNIMFILCGAYYLYKKEKFKNIKLYFSCYENGDHLGFLSLNEINTGMINNFKLEYKYCVFEPKINDIENLVTLYERDGLIYTPIDTSVSDNILITGYRQCPKYWDNDREFAKELFKPKQEVIDTIYKYYPSYDFENMISINVRRGGDYIDLDDKGFGLCNENYFKKCISYFGEDKKYLITTDNIEWCKSIFKGDNFYFVDKEIEEFSKPIIDGYIQTLCKHNIISNSTFSWWGAYLNIHKTRTVLYPMPILNFMGDTPDMIPENDGWIEIRKYDD